MAGEKKESGPKQKVTVEGMQNLENGNPVLISSDGGRWEGRYEGMAVLEVQGETYICLTPYWEGIVPEKFLGKAVRLVLE